MTTEIQKQETKDSSLFAREQFEEPRNFGELLPVCKLLVVSGLLPKEIRTAEQAAVVILTGRELGLRMMASLRSIYVVNQKPSLSAQMMLSLAYGTKELENIDIKEEGMGEAAKCTVVIKRKGKTAYSYTFSVDMAKKMQKYANEWLKQPENMCKQRALSGNLRVTFPDAILGMYTPEEIELQADSSQPLSGKPIVSMPEPIDASPSYNVQEEPETDSPATIEDNGEPSLEEREEIKQREIDLAEKDNNPPPANKANLITQDQINRLFALAKQYSVSEAKIREFVKQRYNLDHLHHMDKTEYGKLIGLIAKKVEAK